MKKHLLIAYLLLAVVLPTNSNAESAPEQWPAIQCQSNIYNPTGNSKPKVSDLYNVSARSDIACFHALMTGLNSDKFKKEDKIVLLQVYDSTYFARGNVPGDFKYRATGKFLKYNPTKKTYSSTETSFQIDSKYPWL